MVGFEITKDEFQTLAGMPLGLMFEKVLPNDKKSLSAECEKLYKKYYIDEEHFADETVLFKGVKETIYKFKNDGFYMAVASSKPKRILDKMISTFDLEGFSYVLGTEESSFKHKPDPEIVNYIMGQLNIIKFVIDILMLVLMILEYSKIYTGQSLHEIFGIALLVLFVIHNILNINLYKALFKGKYNVQRTITTIIDIAFLLCMLFTIILGIPISDKLFKFLGLDGNITMRKLHTIFGYWGLVILSIHLGLHFNMIFAKLKRNIIFYILEVGIIIYGIFVMIHTSLLEHLIGISSFSVPQGNLVIVLLNNLCLTLSIAFIIYNIMKLSMKKKK